MSDFQKNHLQEFHFLNRSGPVDEYGNWLFETGSALGAITDKFAAEIELTGKLKIGKLLRETYRFLNDFSVSYQNYISPPEDEEGNIYPQTEPIYITNSEIYKLEDKLGEIIRLMRSELMPLKEEKRKGSHREYWWEKESRLWSWLKFKLYKLKIKKNRLKRWLKGKSSDGS
ncbi:MAG: hypothetical protein ABR985_02610 [Methanotrichaceae archaeon]